MQTPGEFVALGGEYPSSSLYMRCDTAQSHPEIVQKLVNAFVETLHWIKTHAPEQIAAKMPPQYAAGGKDLYIRSIRDSIGMYNGDGLMKPEDAQSVLNILGKYSANVKPVHDRIDLAKTYTNDFARGHP
jgi:NitT/TauT family transport system substrate-binding protein